MKTLRAKSTTSFDEPEIWKINGDEILFTARIRNSEEALLITRAFYRAVCQYDGSSSPPKPRVKGTAWTAGFPLRNTEVPLPQGPVESTVELKRDYLGPDIDAGFRLTTTARAGRLTVSMDLADILTRIPEADLPGNLHFFHVGWEPLKGVNSEAPYPIFWMTEGSERPTLLAWEGHSCRFTNRFLLGDSELTVEKLRELVVRIRKDLPDLRLFPPYFDPKDMPAHHRDMWDEWEQHETRIGDLQTYKQS